MATQTPTISELRWRCRRGMLELDILLNDYLDKHETGFEAEELKLFEYLLEYPDQTLQQILVNEQVPVDKKLQILIKKIRGQAPDYWLQEK